MAFIKPCKEYLAFDDRKIMLIGMPIMAMLMPIILNITTNVECGYWTHQVPESFIFVVGFWLTYRWMIIAMRKKMPHLKQAFTRVIIQVILVLISAPLLKGIFGFGAHAFMSMIDMTEHTMPGLLQTMVSIYLPCLLIITFYEAIYYFIQYKNAIIERERVETEHLQMELTHLRNQINPHFLFNSLNTLMNLIPKDQDTAMNYLSKLSKFYRHAVGVKEEKLIPLQKEVEFAHLYIDLLYERFQDALDVTINIENTSGQMIPPLSLQLLLENAVKHNVVSRESPLKISIEFDAEVGELVISNNVQEKIDTIESSGVGLENIKRRFAFFTLKPIKIVHNTDFFQVALPTILRPT